MEVADIAGQIWICIYWLQIVFINKVRTRPSINPNIVKSIKKMHLIAFEFQYGGAV